MKKFSKKSILQKTIIAILIALLLSNFIVPTYSHADIGGVLMDPISDFLCSIGDVIINVLQKCMTGDWGAGFSLNGGFLVESTEFFSSDKYKNMKTTEEGEKIYPNDENEGFNKTLLFGNTQDYHIPIATYSPEQIFAGKVAGLDINFINPNTDMDGDGVDDVDDDGELLSSAAKLQPTIATWYVALRNLTVVGLLSVLVYVGIRIIISSTASDKAKYKQMLMDWLIALCLVFFLHYIMSFTLTLTQSICDAIAGSGEESVIITVVDGSNGGSFETNLLGAARFKTQYNDFGQKITYLIMYIFLVGYTVMFTWFYLKRLLMMAFLTLVAPLVALTYPIDKMNDGKAQAFDSWLKEYVFNVLIQPFHLIIYTVLIGSAMDLATTNIIYSIAALAFILPAENILRKFFGFEKAGAGTLGTIGNIAALSAAGGIAKRFLGGKGGSASGGRNSTEGEKPPRTSNSNVGIGDVDAEELLGDGNGQQDKDNNNNNNKSGGPSATDANLGNESENPVERMRREALEEQIADGQLSENELTDEQRRLLGKNNNENNNNNSDNTQNEEKNITVKRLKNWTNAHGGKKHMAGRAIKGVAKFGTKAAFTLAGGTLGAIGGVATGKGITGMVAGMGAGGLVGANLGNRVTRLPSAVANVGKSARNRINRELDLADGTTQRQDATEVKDWAKDENNIKAIRERYIKDHEGVAPSRDQMKTEMENLKPYLQAGFRNLEEITKAQRAEQYGISNKQSAIVAALSKKQGIEASELRDKNKCEARRIDLLHDYKNSGYSDKVAKQLANQTIEVMKVQNNVASNLKKQNNKN